MYFLADSIVRRVAEDDIAASIESELPEQVTGGVSAEIRGVSVLAQYATGRMERIELTGDDLAVDGVPLEASLVLTGVPPSGEGEVEHAVGTLTLDEAGLNEFIELPGTDGSFTIDDGTIGYAGTVSFLGLELGYTASATAEAAGTEVLLQPVSASLDAAGGSLDLSGAVSRLLDEPIAVCVADRLPAGVEVVGITIGDGSATVRLDARDFPLDEDALGTTGTC
nr:DUF2993 domain-containing protein [Agromyces seonyuensis]